MNRSIYSRRKFNEPNHKTACRPQPLSAYFLQTMPVPMCVLDRLTGKYLDANDAFARLMGLNRENILHKSGADSPAGLGDDNLKKILTRTEETLTVRNLDLIILQGGGKVIKTASQVQLVDFQGHEAVLVTLNTSTAGNTQSVLDQQEKHVQTANQFSLAMAEVASTDEMAQQLASSTFDMLPDSCEALVSLYDPQQQSITAIYQQHVGETFQRADFPEMKLAAASLGLLSDTIHTRQPIITDQRDERHKTVVDRLKLFTPGKLIQSGISLPMIAGGAVIGVLQAFSLKPDRYHSSDAAAASLIANTAASAIHGARLTQILERASQDLSQTYEATINGWSRALELRDFSTERHAERVVSMSIELGRQIGLDEPDLLRIQRGAQLHDIGKMGVPDSVLLKPGPLDEAEWRVMRKHPVYAYELLRPIPKFNDIVDIPYCHHEKWDGSGYPRRLSGREIPLPARVFAVVDVWDALSSNRPYRPAWSQHQVLDYIQQQSNKQFEPEITRAFLDVVKGKTASKRAAATMLRRAI
ncbi:MAG: HD domain-containing phosphohydrolase [Bellilinea sp.]